MRNLTQNDLNRLRIIKHWLKNNASKANKQAAEKYFELGSGYMKKDNWSAAAKNFGESALLFPSPEYLRAHADAEVKMLANIRSRKARSNEMTKSDLEYILTMYQTSLAADNIQKSFTINEKQAVEKKC